MIYCWDQIRRDYIRTELSQRALAQKYGVSVRQISRMSKKEGWLSLKQRYFQEKGNSENTFSEKWRAREDVSGCSVSSSKNGAGIVEKTDDCGGDYGESSGSPSEKCVEISTLTEKLCQKANIAIDRLEGEALDAQKLRQLVQSVKDLKELKRAEEESSDTGQLEKLIQGLCEL